MVEVLNLDCREYLTGPFCPMFDFAFADPPFNIGQKYNGFKDNLPTMEYRQFTLEWIWYLWQRMKPGAAMVLHGSVECSREIIRVLQNLEIDTCIETELVWAYNFGQCRFDNFIQTHCRAIVVRRPGLPNQRKFYVENVLTESVRLRMGDKRVLESEFKGKVPFGTVWGMDTDDNQVVTEPLEGLPNWGRVQGNNLERRKGHPNQLPEKYVERCLLAYSNIGDCCFDPFGGSGTTAIVCRKLNRHCITTDVSEWNCESIKSSLKAFENV